MKGDRLKSVGINFPIMGFAEAGFWALPGKERTLLVAAYFTDVVKVREVKQNRGTWVERMLAKVGLGGGYAWCAAFISYCCWLAEFDIGPKKNRARVKSWVDWAKAENRLGFKPQRGDLFFWLNKNGTGHIGETKGDTDGDGWQETFEGNTNGQGSREGNGAFRQKRLTKDLEFIRL